KIAIKCRLIRNHGEAIVRDNVDDMDLINIIGYNFRMTELHAAIAYEQTKKLEKINNIRKKNYNYLVKALKEKFSNYLTPQRITHPESYYAYTASFKWNENKSGVNRNTIADALNAEGIPVFKGYHRLMCDHPMFKRKIAFGSNHYPWLDSKINYKDIDVENARQLVDYEFLGFLQIGFPNNYKDMDDIINAFDKIIHNLGSLKNYNNSYKNLDLGR
ncbi:MAG: hypothetical protein CBD98_002485, partial [Flavobacteriaceae bacterium TMED238]